MNKLAEPESLFDAVDVLEEIETKPRRWKAYGNTKSTGVPWVGDIPSHWRCHRIKWTVTACKNGIWGEEPDGLNDVVCVRVADFDRVGMRVSVDDPTKRAVTAKERQGRLLRSGDLLLEKSGGGELQPVGAVTVYDHDTDAVCSNFVARMPVAVGEDTWFLAYLHHHLYAGRVNTRSIKQSIGIQNLDARQYLEEVAALPPLPEQRAIAAFLRRETAKIDGLVEKKRRLIDLLKEKRSALISHAVTKGLNPKAPMKPSGDRWLEKIPAHWTLRPLGTAIRYISYGFTNPMPTSDETDDPFMLTANDIQDGRIAYEGARRTTQSAFLTEVTDKSRPKPGDILVTKDGTLGRIAVADETPICINQSVALLRVNNVASVDFVQWCLRSAPYQERILFDAGGTTIKHIYITRIVKMPLACPQLSEQSEICAAVRAISERYELLTDRVLLAIESLLEYRSALISAAVTGKIDVRDNSSEAIHSGDYERQH